MIEWINEITGMHEVASRHGHVGNHMLGLIHWFMAVLFVGWTLFLAYILVKFRRKKNPKAIYKGVTSHFSTHIEAGVVIVEVVLLRGFAFPLWAARSDVKSRPVGEEVVNLRAVGEQYRQDEAQDRKQRQEKRNASLMHGRVHGERSRHEK